MLARKRMSRRLLPLGPDDRSAKRRCLNLDTGVAGKDDVASGAKEVVVNGKPRGVEAEACGEIAISCDDADDAANESESIGCYAGLRGEVAVFIESAAGKHGQQQRSDDAGL